MSWHGWLKDPPALRASTFKVVHHVPRHMDLSAQMSECLQDTAADFVSDSRESKEGPATPAIIYYNKSKSLNSAHKGERN